MGRPETSKPEKDYGRRLDASAPRWGVEKSGKKGHLDGIAHLRGRKRESLGEVLESLA